MKNLIEKIFDFNVSEDINEYEKTEEELEKDYNYIKDYIEINKVPTEKDLTIQFLISKHFSVEEAISIIEKCKDIPLEKFLIDIFYSEGNDCEERKNNILNSFNKIIDRYTTESTKEL